MVFVRGTRIWDGKMNCETNSFYDDGTREKQHFTAIVMDVRQLQYTHCNLYKESRSRAASGAFHCDPHCKRCTVLSWMKWHFTEPMLHFCIMH